MNSEQPIRIDRRVAIKWMLTAGAGAMLVNVRGLGETAAANTPGHSGYGTDPDMMKAYKAGDYWPLTFTSEERRLVAALCDVLLPADELSPSASGVGVTDFMDEWVSAPYPDNLKDRTLIMEGLGWLDGESRRTFGKTFADATDNLRESLCAAIAHEPAEGAEPKSRWDFFKRFRNLTAAGFYTTPIGMKDLGYVGNVVLAKFEGPPADLVARLGLQDEVAW